MTRRLASLAAIALAATILLYGGHAASAHSSLQSSNPADKQVLTTAPSAVTLSFSDDLVASPGSFIWVSSGGESVMAGDSMLMDSKTVMVSLKSGLATGKYFVFWKSTAADDGGVTFGQFTFFVGNPDPADVAATAPGVSVAVPEDATDMALRNPGGSESAMPTATDAAMHGGHDDHAAAAETATQTTASYALALEIGPVAEMLTPEDVAGATSGEVMVPGPGMMPDIAAMMMDDGLPANHHLEVHIHDRMTGLVVSGTMPTISVTSQATGETRELDNVMAMYDVAAGMSDLHFGQNVYLPDGSYTITVRVSGELATFPNVKVSGAPSMPAD
jgi:methionine-rich copper-binding protein CopC